MTQAQLGALSGIGQTAISRIESGQRKVDTLELVRIAVALDIEVGDLLDRARQNAASEVQVLGLRLSEQASETAGALSWAEDLMERLDELERDDRDG